MADLVPATIGKYRIERELGRGASGVVYLGLDGLRGRKVAVKQMHAHLLAEPAQAARHRRQLQSEAALAARLRHPNIVRLLDADESATPPYLVFEYLSGRPLSDHASADTLLPVAQVLDIAFKCGHALEYAERQGLVHRDIKPANLLLADDGEVKLVDFGAALSTQSEATQLAGLVGSPSYMSPEQVREETLTHHSDMFSLGVVVYELLTGRRPFDGETDFATLYRISHEAARRCRRKLTPLCCAHWPRPRRTAMRVGPTGQTPCSRSRAACRARSRRTRRPSVSHACGPCRSLPSFTMWPCGS